MFLTSSPVLNFAKAWYLENISIKSSLQGSCYNTTQKPSWLSRLLGYGIKTEWDRIRTSLECQKNCAPKTRLETTGPDIEIR
ncbi:hypothetical protein V2J09_000292 [Rumex salicifolius]